MADVNFCPKCGEKRVQSARFCISCGNAFQGGPNNLLMLYGVSLAALIVATAVVFGIVKMVNEKPVMPTPPQTVETDDHDHDHAEEDPNLKALKQKADNGGPEAKMDLAEYLFAHGERDRDYLFQAAKILEELSDKYPDHAYTLRLLGNLYFDLGIPEKSVIYYQKYLQIHPDDPNVRTDMGTQLLRLEKTEEAVDEYLEATRIFPDFYNTHFNLSIAYERLGRLERAKIHREKALEIEKKYGRKVNPPPRQLSRLPGETSAMAESVPGDRPENEADSDLDYGPLENFFRNHMVIGPKMTGFRVEAGRALLLVRNFPMDAMPANMRQSFEQKIRERLQAVGSKAVLDIRDADQNKVLATYEAMDTP